MRKKRNREQGQALLELLMLLFGFTIVFLGLIFVSGLADADLTILLQARNDAELTAANAKNLPSGNMTEFDTSTRSRSGAYDDRPEIDFSPMDKTRYAAGNSINSFPAAFTTPTFSEPDNTDNDYFGQAKLSEWKDMRTAANNVFRSNFVTDLSSLNARGAADLVAGRSQSSNEVTTLNGSNHTPGTVNALYRTLNNLIGVRITAGTLKNAPANTVYMPAFAP